MSAVPRRSHTGSSQPRTRTLCRGEILWRQDDPANEILVLEHGSLGVCLPGSTEEEFAYVPSMVAGATALRGLFERTAPRRTSVIVARTDGVRLRCCRPEEIRDSFEAGSPELAMGLLRSLLAHVLFNWMQVLVKADPCLRAMLASEPMKLAGYSKLLGGPLDSWVHYGEAFQDLHELRERSRGLYLRYVVGANPTSRVVESAGFFKVLFGKPGAPSTESPATRFHRNVLDFVQKLAQPEPQQLFLPAEREDAKILAYPLSMRTKQGPPTEAEGPEPATRAAEEALRHLESFPEATRYRAMFFVARRCVGKLENPRELSEIRSVARERLRAVFKGPAKSFTVKVIKGRPYVYEQWRGEDGKKKTRYIGPADRVVMDGRTPEPHARAGKRA